MAKPLILNLDALPLRAHRRLGPTGRMLAKQDGMRSKFFGMTHFRKNASVNPLESHTNKKPCIYVKTMGFKPFRDTYLRATFSQSLLNHILIKNAIGVGGTPAISSTSSTSPTSSASNRQAPIFPVLLFLFRTGGW